MVGGNGDAVFVCSGRKQSRGKSDTLSVRRSAEESRAEKRGMTIDDER